MGTRGGCLTGSYAATYITSKPLREFASSIKHADRPLLESYLELAQKFPEGLANIPLLPEELSGTVNAMEAKA